MRRVVLRNSKGYASTESALRGWTVTCNHKYNLMLEYIQAKDTVQTQNLIFNTR